METIVQATAELLAHSPAIPVVVIDDADHAVPLARAMLAGGIPVIEFTLRTPAALPAIRRVAAEVPEITVGAGTVNSPAQAGDAASAGAQFLVTPGCTDRLVDAVLDTGLPCLPGVGTASEAMRLTERGLRAMKFFPAQPSGGPAYLRALHGPLPDIVFCPSGGITADTAPGYLALPNVRCVGASWLAPKGLLAGGDWAGIEALARQAAALGATNG